MGSNQIWLSGAVLALSLIVGACGDEAGPAPTPPPLNTNPTGPGGAAAGGSDVETGACDEGEIRDCKVQIDANNCFVGEQKCINEEWSQCVETGSFDDPGT